MGAQVIVGIHLPGSNQPAFIAEFQVPV
jgi:hypothetical protein